MIAEFPKTILILLAVLTLLGAVIGYCVALIFAKRAARRAIEASRLEQIQERRALDSDLQAARRSIAKLRSSAPVDPVDNESFAEREKALETHSQMQAQRIRTLEAQLSSLEEKQLRLRREFASYKTTNTRELGLARQTNDHWQDTEDLPTLSRKVERASSQGRARTMATTHQMGTGSSGSNADDLGFPLSRDIDIPALEESELPDSLDDLDFDTSITPGGGAKVGG